MFRVAIVEDEWDSFENLKKSFDRYTEEKGILFDITRFPNGVDFLADYKPDYDMVFMDVDMPEMNGFEVSRQLREIDKNVILMFVTRLARFAIQGYSFNALDYVIKPVDYASFKLKIDRAVKISRVNTPKELLIKYRNGVVRIPMIDLLYVEVIKHDLIYHTIDGDYLAYGTMKEVESKLPASSFERCNKCYLVNLKHVTKIEKGYVYLGETKLAVSRLKAKPFTQAFHRYIVGE